MITCVPKPPAVHLVLADPPWKPKDKLPGKSRGASKNYPTMTTVELMSYLPILESRGEVNIAENALFAIWRLSSMIEDAIRVGQAWGGRLHSELVWNKLTKNGKQHFGMGRILRGSHESCFLFVRGKPTKIIKSKSVRSSFSAVVPYDENHRPIHSAKPDEQYEIFEELVRGPRLELFARRTRAGWQQHGNQFGSRDRLADEMQ